MSTQVDVAVRVVKRYSNAETAAGQTVHVPLENMQPEAGGRISHLAGLIVAGTITGTNAGATAHSGELFRQVFQDVTLDIEGFRHIDGVDGNVIEWMRSKRHLDKQGDFNPLADNDGVDGAVTRNIQMHIPFNRPLAGDRKMTQDGLVPLSSFVGRGSVSNRFEFRIAAALGESLPGAVPGVSIAGLENVTVYAIIIPLDDVNVPSPWKLERRSTHEAERLVIDTKNHGGIEACSLVPRDATNVLNGDNFERLALEIDGDVQWRDLSPMELANGVRLFRGGVEPLAIDDAGEHTGELQFIDTTADQNRTSYARATRLSLRFNRPAGFTGRVDAYLLTTGNADDAYIDRFALAAGAPPDPSDATRVHPSVVFRLNTAKGKGVGGSGIKGSFLDHRIAWPGMPYAKSAEMLRQRLDRIRQKSESK